jgi:hypothetical protein
MVILEFELSGELIPYSPEVRFGLFFAFSSASICFIMLVPMVFLIGMMGYISNSAALVVLIYYVI